MKAIGGVFGKVGNETVNPRGYIPGLDGVRALAVLSVVVFHARGTLLPGGYLGVDVFFVLSGFLITGILQGEFSERGSIDLRSFYRRRALRLLPALAVVCGATAAVFAFAPGLSMRSATLLGTVTALTYTSSIVAASGASHLGWMLPTWSLSVEEYFYFVWPLALLALLRRARTVHWVLITTATAVVYRLAAGFVQGWSLQRLSYAPDTRAEELLIGCLTALLLPWLSSVLRQWHVWVSLIVICGAMIVPAATGDLAYRFGGSTVASLLAAVVIAGSATNPGWIVTRLLSVRPLTWVGKRSYGIYLWNLPLIGMLALVPLPHSLEIPIKGALALVIPALSFRFVETPMLRLAKKSPGRLSAAPPSSAPAVETLLPTRSPDVATIPAVATTTVELAESP